jgi:hypothetical protein
MAKSKNIADAAAQLYVDGLSVDGVAVKLNVSYRCARRAIKSKGVNLRDPSARLRGRTSPMKKRTTHE